MIVVVLEIGLFLWFRALVLSNVMLSRSVLLLFGAYQVEVEDTLYPTEEYGNVPPKGRPSLRTLRNRLSDQQDIFSSEGEVSSHAIVMPAMQ